TCSKLTLGSRRVFHRVTQSFPQGDPIIFFDHPRVISATRAWHTPVATHQPQAEGSPPERLGGQQPGRSRPDRDANKIRRYIRIKCYSRDFQCDAGAHCPAAKGRDTNVIYSSSLSLLYSQLPEHSFDSPQVSVKTHLTELGSS